MRPVHTLASARAVAAAAILAFSSIPIIAQQVDASSQQSTSASAAGTHVSDSSNSGGNLGRDYGAASVSNSASASGLHGAHTSSGGSAYAANEMRPVSGELRGKLDAKSARPGDQVIVKTTQKTMLADGTEIPKGTRLVGHVTEAQEHAKGHAESQIGIAFDRAELKGGRSIPIHSAIRSIAPAPSAMASMANNDDLGAGGGGMAGGGRGMVGGGSREGGGLLGGGGAAVGGVAPMAGRVGGGLDSTAGVGAGAAGSTLGATSGATGSATGRVAGNATGEVGQGMHGAAGATSDFATHATAVPGVMLGGDITGSASGVLSAANRNVHLDSGTQMVLGVAATR
jgi:hypothetical protein